MNRRVYWIVALSTVALLVACSETISPAPDEPVVTDDFGANPFLENNDPGKEDTGYVNRRGIEAHVTIEADVQASEWRILRSPAEITQYAMTYLRKRNGLYVEILGEDATAVTTAQWLVQGEWLAGDALDGVDRALLTHFRMNNVNAVVLQESTEGLAGQVYEAVVPISPYTTFADAGEACADYNSHIDLGQSVYWYLWNPDKSGCELETQTMTITISELLPHNPESYPEYDQLWADGRLEIVVLYGKLDDGDVAEDYNWRNVTRLGEWLVEAGFTKEEEAPLGDRYTRTVGELTEVIDIYGPDIFHSVADHTRFNNWQRAVSEHEVVMYNGHSVLGTGYAFEQVEYPDFYQIFSVASCLSYEYYVDPILEGKGTWATVDVISNVEPTYYSENYPLTTSVLSRLLWGFENEGRASWQDIMETVSNRLSHSRFGVSGARDNQFTPGSTVDPNPELRQYTQDAVVIIPDYDMTGVTSTLEVGDDVTIGSLQIRVDVTHTWVGDLSVVLSHDGVDHTVWDRLGGSNNNIQEVFDVSAFDGLNAQGSWTLSVVDGAWRDEGTINSWTVLVTPATE